MNQTDKARKIPIWLLALTMGAGTVGNYIVSPALSPITEYFGVDEASSQAILTGFLFQWLFSHLFLVLSLTDMAAGTHYYLVWLL